MRYLATSLSNSVSTVRSTWPVFCIRVVPVRRKSRGLGVR